MTLKIKILGSGNAAKHHKAALEQLPDIYQIVDQEPDVIAICTPPFMHLQNIIDNKKVRHVVVEKPFVKSLLQMDSLNADIINQSYHPVLQYEYADNIPPEIKQFNEPVIWNRDDDYHKGWRGKYETAFGGVLASHSIHYLDYIDYHHATIRAIECSITHDEGIEVETSATIKLYFGIERAITLRHRIGKLDKGWHINAKTGFKEFYEEVYRNIDHGIDTFQRGRRAMELLTACYWSAYTNDPAYLPIPDNHPFYKSIDWLRRMREIR